MHSIQNGLRVCPQSPRSHSGASFSPPIFNHLQCLDRSPASSTASGAQNFGHLRPYLPLLCQNSARFFRNPLFLRRLDFGQDVPRLRKAAVSNGHNVTHGSWPLGTLPLINTVAESGDSLRPQNCSSPSRGCLPPRCSLANGPVYCLLWSFSPITSVSRKFLNPALFFFANFPWQGDNVRGVPKEP